VNAFPAADETGSQRGTEAGLIFLAVIWGVNFPLIKIALAVVPPLAFNALRFPLAALALLLLLRSLGIRQRMKRSDVVAIVSLGLLGNVVYQGFFILGVARTTAGNASLLLATSPAWTVVLSSVTGQERASRAVWGGVLATLAGMALVVAGGAGMNFQRSTLDGDLLMMLAAVAWAAYTVGSRPLVQRYGAMSLTAWTLWIGTVGVLAIGLPSLRQVDLGTITPGLWGIVVYAGVLSISVAYALWNRGVRRLGNSRTAVYSNLVPVVALLTAWITLGERPTGMQVAGAVVILWGLRMTRRRSSA
jgi:drug/metabolite transporter (DMT)-like permease